MISIIQHIASQLQPAYPTDEAEALAWWIAEETTGLTRTELQFGHKSTKNIPNLQEIITRLLHFEPIQYIFGHILWAGLDLKVTPATLIPRPETAELVYKVDSIKFKVERSKVLDVGTGSGCIAIALKKRHPEWQVTGIDISAEAVEIAKENAKRNNVDVNFQVADIFDPIGEIFNSVDLVVSNPPYIQECEKSSMRPNVLNFEPAMALFAPDDDPLRFYRRIAQLHLGKELFFEINEAFSEEIQSLLSENGYTYIQITNDIYGKPRIIEGRMA